MSKKYVAFHGPLRVNPLHFTYNYINTTSQDVFLAFQFTF